MPIRLSGRHDGLLLAGLSIALLTVFDRPIGWLLRLANDVEMAYGMRLVPALVVLTGIFVVHQHVKRQEMKAQAAAAAAAARQAEERLAELERLHAFGQQLSGALTLEAVQVALWRYLPRLSEGRDAWAAISVSGRCQVLAESGGMPVTDLEDRLRRVVDADRRDGAALGTVREAGHCCFPMVAGGTVIGVLGVAEAVSPVTPGAERALAAASSLLGIAVRNVQLFAEVRERAVTDALTGCLRPAHTLDMLDSELRRSRRSGAPLAVVMLDLDGFKQVNDTDGHLAGDAALAAVGKRLREVLRHSDLCCRYGGDEFLLVLPETPIGGATHVAQTVRREIAQLQIHSSGGAGTVTASIGVAAALPGETDPAMCVRRADHALYEAKRMGGDRVAVSETADSEVSVAASSTPALFRVAAHESA